MDNLYEKLKALCEQKGVSPSRMCIDIGTHPSFMGDLKAGRKKGMSAATADKVAKYFGVSVEYILGTGENNNKKMPTISNDSEQELLDLFRSANPQMRMLVLSALKSAAPTQSSEGVVESAE